MNRQDTMILRARTWGLCCSLLLLCALPGVLHAQSAAEWFEQQRLQPEPGRCLDLAVDLSDAPGLSIETAEDGSELRYRMAFNQIAEGWSWHDGPADSSEDYYRFKYLPLQSVLEPRGEYQAEDKIGAPQTMQRLWRYDYFLAFENLYDFYPRRIDDDAGFVAHLASGWSGEVGMRARACLLPPVVSESTTFWKATSAKPTDFTLKKRYLMARLIQIEFVDARSGKSLAVLHPSSTSPAAF